ncbi:MAG: hypothetical protein ACRES8_05305 [Nevskiaceae bacterium]
MFSNWLREELLALHPLAYLAAALLATLVLAFLLRYSFTHLWRYRLIEDTPTSNIETAAQGFVELDGRAAAAGPEPMRSPLRHVPCVWWSYRIEELETGVAHVGDTGLWGLGIAAVLFVLHLFEVRRSGRLVEEGTSGEFFLIRDRTGACLVDPEEPHVVGARTKVWTIGERRYEECVIGVGDRLYALGLFRTHRAHLERSEAQDVSDLISDWKLDQANLAARFDANRDGRIDQREWEAARAVALGEVRSRRLQRGSGPELHILCRTLDKRPFMLSLLRQEGLVGHHWFRSAMSIIGSLMVGILILWSFTVRSPW